MEYNETWLKIVHGAMDLGQRTGRKRKVFAVRSVNNVSWHWVTLPVPDLPIGGSGE